jgi:1-acyl-sn-glycerol-3-phosphate acyltransferase
VTTVALTQSPSGRGRLITLATISGLLILLASIAIGIVAVVTLGAARRLYAALATGLARLVLSIWRIRMVVHRDGGWPSGQVVYISNHPSTLDLFLLVALGLPRTRFFLSGFLRKYIPLGLIAWLMGTFFTVPQDRPDERTRIFQRAARVLRRTGESVYLSPEGTRTGGGWIGPFNKGAFHLAISLGAPIVPIYFDIPSSVTPGTGYDARPGAVHVHVLPAIDTSGWRVDDLTRHKDQVRELFVQMERRPAERRTSGPPEPLQEQ